MAAVPARLPGKGFVSRGAKNPLMPGSDDQYDQVHTYSQDHAGKSKTTKPAVREIGRDGAPLEKGVFTERTAADQRGVPSGVHHLFYDTNGDLRTKNSAGTLDTLTGRAPEDANFVVADKTQDLTHERKLAVGTGLGLTDGGAGFDITIDADTLRGEPFVTTAAASSLSNETVPDQLTDVYGSPVSVAAADLRFQDGQSIEGGGGTHRLNINAGQTQLLDSDGKRGINLNTGGVYAYDARISEQWLINDQEGGFFAVEYFTSASSPGDFRLTNAVITTGNGTQLINNSQGSSLTAQDSSTVDATYGTEEEGVIKNNRTRIAEIESRLQTHGLIA